MNAYWLTRVAFFALAVWLLWRAAKWSITLFPALSVPYVALKRLGTLCDRIVATTDEESGAKTSVDKSFFSVAFFGNHRRRVIPVADVREIETELAEIINMIQSSWAPFGFGCKANFIIVFDEMDKIDPAVVAESKVAEMPEYTDSVKGFPDGMESRQRRKNVLRLLANIKLFISSAKAKFVFISGRELYDAYMADLSDRDFAISSIFSGVINVDSFLSPEGGQTDVRSMSEWYIANRLMPKEYLWRRELENARDHGVLKKEKPSLRWYYEYLIELCGDGDSPEVEARRKDVEFVVGFLRTFAAYLTHISNGSPKKIFLYFEKYLQRNVDTLQMVDWGDVCVVGDNGKTHGHHTRTDERMVLFFDSTQQKNINFVNYLTNPIMGTITNDLSRFGDRFLVSLSFVIDHIYKHHNRSFSWRNLEQIPDLLKTSKAPQLREQVSSVMEYLSQIHITKTLIGLNEYKFRKSIAEEISIMSKMSDEASAIFNFTLDESLPVIQHNIRLLEYYTKLARQDAGAGELNQRYLPIIARIHSNLGDLRFWDEDYYSAALEYRAAVDTFSREDEKAGFLTKVRCSLKLGLTYEMRKLYPNAYLLYSQLIEFLIHTRWVDEKALGLDVVDLSLDGWREKRLALVDPGARLCQDRQKCEYQRQQHPDFFNIRDEDPKEVRRKYREQFGRELWNYNQNEQSVEYGANVDGVISSFSHDLTLEKSRVVSSLSLFEEVRYVYQAILAKLSLVEKLGMSGITQTNIDLAEGEFMVLQKSINLKEKFIVAADFYRKLAEILYFKNSLTILSQNQDSLYSTIYYGDTDLLAHLDEFCRFRFGVDRSSNALRIVRDVKFFFHSLDNPASESDAHPKFKYELSEKTLKCMFETIRSQLDDYFDVLVGKGLLQKNEREAAEKNVREYIDYNVERVYGNDRSTFGFNGLGYCDYHRHLLRKHNLRPPCYACKYYCRSLEVLTENMFYDKSVFYSPLSKSIGVLRNTFRSNLLYLGSSQLVALAQTLVGYGNVMFSCSSGNDCEGDSFHTASGISPDVIRMLRELTKAVEEQKKQVIDEYVERLIQSGTLSRLDKSLLYYWDACRVFLIAGRYGDAVDGLNRIITLLNYYVETVSFFKHNSNPVWGDESETLLTLIGEKPDLSDSFVYHLFRLVVRYTGNKYDLSNLSELQDIKWVFSKGLNDDVDLSMLSSYPDIRAAFLRIIEMVSRAHRYLQQKRPTKRLASDYHDFVARTYPLIAPTYRRETTSYDEILGYYTKVRYNDHILNNLFGGNPLAKNRLEDKTIFFSFRKHFYTNLAKFLSADRVENGLAIRLFEELNDRKRRLEVVEYLIIDTLVCISHMTKIFTPHNHLTTYSKSFVGVVYNYFWEWSERYEFLYSLYQFEDQIEKWGRAQADQIIDHIVGVRDSRQRSTRFDEMNEVMSECVRLLKDVEYDKNLGSRADVFYSRISHEVDDTMISTVFSNYTAETALQYYTMAEEANTEGDAYHDMLGQMYFLNDDMNNDTNQFNSACDRFLLNSGIIAMQREKLENLFKFSAAYDLSNAYIVGATDARKRKTIIDGQFDHSLFINSEY